MANRGVFKSDKRKKELMRQKKQEEKRLRRFNKNAASNNEKSEVAPLEETEGKDQDQQGNVSS